MSTSKRLTIYDIKHRTLETEPYFFDRKTLKFFGQTLKDFSVLKLSETVYHISAPIRHNGRSIGHRTVKYFNTRTNTLHTKDPREEEKE
jgi:hypothetical protein